MNSPTLSGVAAEHLMLLNRFLNADPFLCFVVEILDMIYHLCKILASLVWIKNQ